MTICAVTVRVWGDLIAETVDIGNLLLMLYSCIINLREVKRRGTIVDIDQEHGILIKNEGRSSNFLNDFCFRRKALAVLVIGFRSTASKCNCCSIEVYQT